MLCALGGCAGEEPRPAASAPASVPGEEARQVGKASNIDLVQGRWQSRDDEALVVEIRGDQFISWYDDEKIGAETLDFVSDCGEQRAEPDGEYFVLRDEAGVLCYHLTHVDEALLEYTYVERGNTLSYTKLE